MPDNDYTKTLAQSISDEYKLLIRLGEAADQAANGKATCDCPACTWIEARETLARIQRTHKLRPTDATGKLR